MAKDIRIGLPVKLDELLLVAGDIAIDQGREDIAMLLIAIMDLKPPKDRHPRTVISDDPVSIPHADLESTWLLTIVPNHVAREATSLLGSAQSSVEPGDDRTALIDMAANEVGHNDNVGFSSDTLVVPIGDGYVDVLAWVTVYDPAGDERRER